MCLRRLFIALLALSGAAAPAVLAETIAIIGTGNVGMALGTEFAAQGNSIVYGSRSPGSDKTQALVAGTQGDASAALPAEAAGQADIVVLAVPGMVVEAVTRGLGDLEGKIVIDATNPLVMTEAAVGVRRRHVERRDRAGGVARRPRRQGVQHDPVAGDDRSRPVAPTAVGATIWR